MPKKQKIRNCIECGNHFMLDMSHDVLCNHIEFNKAREIANPIRIKADNFIPEWCPLEEWEG